MSFGEAGLLLAIFQRNRVPYGKEFVETPECIAAQNEPRIRGEADMVQQDSAAQGQCVNGEGFKTWETYEVPLRRGGDEEPGDVWCNLDEVERLEVRHAVKGTKNIIHCGAHGNVLPVKRQMGDGVREEACGPAPGAPMKLNALERRAFVTEK